jgi:uncharacterized protein (DUF488 family)
MDVAVLRRALNPFGTIFRLNPRLSGWEPALLLTVGHGTLGSEELAELLVSARVELIVDIRSAPGSRRHPHFGREQMERWLPAAGIDYRTGRAPAGRGQIEERRFAPPGVPGLRRLRGYADYMATGSFAVGLARLLGDGAACSTAAMCAKTLWRRCHRRFVADAAVPFDGATVHHLGHDGRLAAHR